MFLYRYIVYFLYKLSSVIIENLKSLSLQSLFFDL